MTEDDRIGATRFYEPFDPEFCRQALDYGFGPAIDYYWRPRLLGEGIEAQQCVTEHGGRVAEEGLGEDQRELERADLLAPLVERRAGTAIGVHESVLGEEVLTGRKVAARGVGALGIGVAEGGEGLNADISYQDL